LQDDAVEAAEEHVVHADHFCGYEGEGVGLLGTFG
jgi:hypothetical protein